MELRSDVPGKSVENKVTRKLKGIGQVLERVQNVFEDQVSNTVSHVSVQPQSAPVQSGVALVQTPSEDICTGTSKHVLHPPLTTSSSFLGFDLS